MNTGPRLVVMTDEFVEPVCAAFAHVFGESRTPETWRQIYRHSPDGAAAILGVDKSSAVVGHYGATLQKVMSASRGDAVFGQIRDVFTRPAARSAGIGHSSLFAQMGRRFQEDYGEGTVDLIFGFPSERHFRLGSRLLGYQKISGLTLWEREIPVPGATKTGRLGALLPVARFGREIDELWAGRPATDTVVVPRNAAFLNWRFTQRPDRQYMRYRYDSFLAGGTAGYAVIAHNGPEAKLVDLCLPENVDLLQDMWFQLLNLLGELAFDACPQ